MAETNTWDPTKYLGNNNDQTALSQILYPFGRNKTPPLPYRKGAPAQASGIGLDAKLVDALGTSGQTQAQGISGAYGNARAQAGTRVTPGGYYDQRLKATEGLSQMGLRSSLADVLGNEGYDDWKSARDNHQNMELAKYIGDINQMTTLQQVLSGLGGGTQTAGQFYGMFNNAKKKPKDTNYSNYLGSKSGGSDDDFSFA